MKPIFTRVYTDGAAKNNGKKNCIASWAVVKIDCYDKDTDINCKCGGNDYEDKLQQLLSKYKVNVTVKSGILNNNASNNRGELTAILNAMQDYDNVTIYTDSNYSIRSITEWYPKWIEKKKKKLNMDLIGKCYELYKTKNIQFKHVKAHQQVVPTNPLDKIDYYGNALADLYCTNII